MADIQVNALPSENNPSFGDNTINDSGNITTKRTTWQKIYNLFFGTFNSVGSGIVAGGIDQSTATILTKSKNRIDTVAAGTGVVENASAAIGNIRTVQNNGLNDLLWYPFGTNEFFQLGVGLLGAGVPLTIAPGNQASVVCYNANQLTLI